MAHGFKTGGRQKGSLNKVTSEMKATIAATGETPLEYMLRVMRDGKSCGALSSPAVGKPGPAHHRIH
jgi:hypothetical protein